MARRERRDEVGERLLAAVKELLAAGSTYPEISVERMVGAAGVSRSTFYVYFEDKGQLLRAWFERISEELAGAASAWWRLEGKVTRADVRAALAQIVATYRPHMALMAAVYDTASYDAGVREEVDAMMRGNIAGLRKHIRAGQTAGWIAPNLPPGETAAWLTWMAERGFHLMVRQADDAELETLVEAYTDVVWNALYAPVATPAKRAA